VLYNLAEAIRIVSALIQPFMVHTSRKIWDQLGLSEGGLTNWDSAREFGLLPEGLKVSKADALFPRIDIPKELEALAALGAPAEEPAKEEKKEEAPSKEAPKDKASADGHTTPESSEITIDEFAKVQLKVAEVVACERHPNADKLLVLQLKVGEETRQVVSGISKFFEPEALVGRKVILVANLKAVKLRGVESHGMILAAADGEALGLLTVDMPSGTTVS